MELQWYAPRVVTERQRETAKNSVSVSLSVIFFKLLDYQSNSCSAPGRTTRGTQNRVSVSLSVKESSPCSAPEAYCTVWNENAVSKKGQSKAIRSQTHAHSGLCAEEEIRTPTAVTPLPPQSSASTNFATSAGSANLL